MVKKLLGLIGIIGGVWGRWYCVVVVGGDGMGIGNGMCGFGLVGIGLLVGCG